MLVLVLRLHGFPFAWAVEKSLKTVHKVLQKVLYKASQSVLDSRAIHARFLSRASVKPIGVQGD